MDLKPDVCWQLPLRREDTDDGGGHITSVVGEWGRRQWGPGGAQFHWWCTEAPEAFVGRQPVYLAMAEELKAMVGEEVFGRLRAELDRRRQRARLPLKHPAQP
jgi:hypothetical protein